MEVHAVWCGGVGEENGMQTQGNKQHSKLTKFNHKQYTKKPPNEKQQKQTIMMRERKYD